MATNNDGDPPGNGAGDDKFDELISLVMRRSRGEIGNDDIENAISSIIPSSAAVGKVQKNEDAIIPDEGNYDDDDDDDSDSGQKPPQKKRAASEIDEEYLPPAIDAAKTSDSNRNEKLDEIPFGKMGERMLITFGDGPKPQLDVISSALLGTRSCLQRAILDARALHRSEKDKWHKARAAATMHSSDSVKSNMRKLKTQEEFTVTATSIGDSELSFRALGGIDRLRFDTACGFDVDQLRKLFPEEMSAYQRWKKMHKAYTDNSGDEVKKQSKDDNNNDDEDDNDDGGGDGDDDDDDDGAKCADEEDVEGNGED